MAPSAADYRYAAKVAARASGAPVFETLPEAVSTSPQGEGADARHRAKLAARLKPSPPTVTAKAAEAPVADPAAPSEVPPSEEARGDSKSDNANAKRR